MHYKIIADSCCDYVQQGEDILSFVTRVPLSIDLDGRTFIDDASLDCAAFLADMAKSRTAPRSACPSPMAFAEACKGPQQDIYIVTLSAKVSGTYDSAYTGAQMAMAADPEKHVHVFNSHSAAAGEVALCLKLQELAQQGLSFQEVVEAG
ncbi:MAG: DegV family protein, partial [Christensenellales bacterium]|nr:DegV family protein [Christensenellales bacterium]